MKHSGGIKNKLISFFFIITLIFSNVLILLFTQEINVHSSYIGDDSIPPVNGNWVIDSLGNVVTNETITLNGSLIIKTGGSLTFRNVTLQMNCPSNDTYNIEVEPGGEFLIYDYDNNPSTIIDRSKITSAVPDGRHRFYFHVKKNANFKIKNSELHECGYYLIEVTTPYYMRGLCIESENSLIENCIITHNLIGCMLYYYSNNSKIINSIISHNMEHGLLITAKLWQIIHNITIKNSTIASNGQFSTGSTGIHIGLTDNLIIKNCNVYHNPRGISITETKNTIISNCNIINNNYGLFDIGGNQNLIIENNTFVGNLEYSIYSYYDTYLNVQNNYFGTNNEIQINASIYGNNIDFTNWLNYRESNILHINTTLKWKDSIKHLDNGLIINGNLTIENSNIILNNSLGKNFIQVNGRLSLKNSTVKLNKANPEIISVWGGYSIIYSYNSSGIFYDSEFQGQKGICINNDDMKINNITIFGNLSRFKPIYGLLILGKNITIEQCNISDIAYGIEIKSDNNTIRNCNLFSNSFAIEIRGNYNKIFDNQINNNGRGIDINGRNYVNISNFKANNNKFYNNNISNNTNTGISISYSNNNIISNSNISNSGWYGITISTGNNNTIKKCNITFNNHEGVGLFPGIISSPKYNKIYHNNFISNGKNASSLGQALDQGYKNEWDNGYPNGGNYWDDYSGLDMYSGEDQSIMGSDGIGDTPNTISGKGLVDNYPWMNQNGVIELIQRPTLYQIDSPDSDGNFTLTWTWIPNATNYTVYEKLNDDIISIELGPITNFNITRKPNGTYRYFIQAKNDKVVSKKSNNITVIVDYLPEIPKNLRANPISDGNILNITWELNEVDIINYSLWSNFTGSWKESKNITSSNCYFIHDGLINDLKYYYKIQAWDGINQSSGFSKTIFGIPIDIRPPEAPNNLKAMTLSNDTIELIWGSNNESDLAGFDIYRSKDSEKNYTKINDKLILNKSYLDNQLDGNSTYFYKVLTYDEVPNYSNFSDITFNTTHITPPMIISFSPLGTFAPLNSNITIIFSKTMIRASVEKNLIIEPIITGKHIWSDDNHLMVFEPSNKLDENTSYNITILNQTMDFEGGMLQSEFSWEFITVSLPKIISYHPQGNCVFTDTNITIIFGRSMNKLSVEHGFSIEPSNNGTFNWSVEDKKLIFVPNYELKERTAYTITINQTARDLKGYTLANDFVWTFSTGDFTPPEIIYFSPVGKDIEIDSVITITFNEEMNRTTVENNFKITNKIEGQFQWRDNSLIFIPFKNLSYNAYYEVTIDTSAQDKWGNYLQGNNSWKFKTEKKASDDLGQIQNILIVTSISIVFLIIILIIFIIFKNKMKEKKEQLKIIDKFQTKLIPSQVSKQPQLEEPPLEEPSTEKQDQTTEETIIDES